jgi:hypothetical protein
MTDGTAASSEPLERGDEATDERSLSRSPAVLTSGALAAGGSGAATPGSATGAAAGSTTNCRTYTPTNADRLVVGRTERTPPSGVALRNWADPGVLHFTNPASPTCRTLSDVDEFVLHETAGTGNPQNTIQSRRLGIHFVAHGDGSLTQHNDVVDRLSHASGHNTRSIGIEIVNPVRPVPAGWPADRTVSVRPGPRPITLPSLDQCETTTKLVRYFVDGGVIPNVWRGIDGTQFLLGRDTTITGPVSGIVAHSHVSTIGKEDGRFPALYGWLRVVKGYTPSRAYDIAKVLMRDARFVRGGTVLAADVSATALANAAAATATTPTP